MEGTPYPGPSGATFALRTADANAYINIRPAFSPPSIVSLIHPSAFHLGSSDDYPGSGCSAVYPRSSISLSNAAPPSC